MRSLLAVALLAACTSTSTPQVPDAQSGRVLPRSAFAEESRIRVWPRVELLPSNALEFRLFPEDAQSVGGPIFAVFEVKGDVLHEQLDALPRWHWNGDGTRVRLEPQGLKPGAPYLITAEGLQGSDGPYVAWAKPFRVIGPDTTPPDGSRLRVVGAPAPGTLQPLEIRFEEPMHEASVHSLATLEGGRNRPEVWTITDDQRVMVFTPRSPWTDADVRVSVGSNLRDLAGNPMVNLRGQLLVPQVLLE